MLISRGIFVLRNVRRITLDRNGLTLESPVSFKPIPWNQIQRIAKKNRSNFMGQSHETLILHGPDGKEVGEIRDTIDGFAELIQQIEYRLAAASGTRIVAEEEAPPEPKKARRRGILVGSFFTFFALGMILVTVVSLNERMHEKKYPTEGVTANATIIRRYMLKVTPYVEFEFTDSAGQSHRREAMMQPQPWDLLADAKTIPVEYLRSDPSWNRVAGEERVTFESFWPMGIIGFLMFGTGAVFSFMGFDLNNKGGKFQLTRWGRPLKRTSSPA